MEVFCTFWTSIGDFHTTVGNSAKAMSPNVNKSFFSKKLHIISWNSAQSEEKSDKKLNRNHQWTSLYRSGTVFLQVSKNSGNLLWTENALGSCSRWIKSIITKLLFIFDSYDMLLKCRHFLPAIDWNSLILIIF